MATNFPSSLDAFTNPTSTSSMSGALSHAGQHSDVNDAVEALQAKVGADSSAVTSSHDYKIAQLEAQGAYTDSSGSITFSNFTLGNGTVIARYTQIGKFVHYWGTITMGSTSSVGSFSAISLPVAASAYAGGSHFTSSVFYEDPGVQNSIGGLGLSSATLAYFQSWTASGSYVTAGGLASTVPWTWGALDRIQWSMVYEAA